MTPSLVGLFLAAVQVSPPPPTFRVQVETVQVDVSVQHEGKPVLGLRAADFEVRDNGVRQSVELVGMTEMPVQAILLLDISGSMEGEKLAHLRAAAKAFLASLGKGDRVALVTFSQRIQTLSGLEPDLDAVPAHLEKAEAKGMTSLNDAVYTGLKLSDGVSGRSVLLLFTDGADNMSWLSETDVLRVARDSGPVVYAVAAGESHFLRRLTEVTGGRVFPGRADAQLTRAFRAVLAEMRARYLLRYTPQGVPQEGWHDLQVRLKGKKGQVRARRGYFRSAKR